MNGSVRNINVGRHRGKSLGRTKAHIKQPYEEATYLSILKVLDHNLRVAGDGTTRSAQLMLHVHAQDGKTDSA